MISPPARLLGLRAGDDIVPEVNDQSRFSGLELYLLKHNGFNDPIKELFGLKAVEVGVYCTAFWSSDRKDQMMSQLLLL